MGRTRDTSKIFTTTANSIANIDLTSAIVTASTAAVNRAVTISSASPSSLTRIWVDNSASATPAIKTFTSNGWRGVTTANLDFSATGGSIVDFGGYRYHTFTSTSSFVVSSGSKIIETLVIAGAGAGGGFGGNGTGAGGGGAGGVLTSSSINTSAGSYAITVGGGGTGGNSTGGSGNTSVAFG
jgi:hypothetical protein